MDMECLTMWWKNYKRGLKILGTVTNSNKRKKHYSKNFWLTIFQSHIDFSDVRIFILTKKPLRFSSTPH